MPSEVLLLLCSFVVAFAQHAPCYECELFKEEHPDSHPYEEVRNIRSHCTYPCDCPPTPICRDGVHLITDGCGCCHVCARQQGDICDGTHLCDEEKGLVCEYTSETAPTGTCKAIKGASCRVGNHTYEDGESFTPDCRTQCSCQNGSYGCVSLCASENVRPSPGCINPRLVSIPGKCCREWICDSTVPSEPKCRSVSSEWTSCSATCGVGVSLRISNFNADCMLKNETRLCQLRPCDIRRVLTTHISTHHVRRGHQCKATVQDTRSRRLRYGNCSSVRRFSAKYCGVCDENTCCSPLIAFTRKESFACESSALAEDEPSMTQIFNVMIIKRCHCGPCETEDDDDDSDDDDDDAVIQMDEQLDV